MTSKHLRDPATAAAIAKCCMAALTPNSAIVYQSHPEPCKWCPYPFDKKMAALHEFVLWAGFTTDPPQLKPEIRGFMALPRTEQARQASVAAGYTPDEYGEPLLADDLRKQQQTKVKQAKERASGRKDLSSGEFITRDKKRSRPSAPPVKTGAVGGRAGDSQREGGRERGPEARAGAAGRGLPD